MSAQQRTRRGLLGGSTLLMMALTPGAMAQRPEPIPAPSPRPAEAVQVEEETETTVQQDRQDREAAEALRGGDDAAPEAREAAAVVPEGYVRIAVDVDGDGQYDRTQVVPEAMLRQAGQNEAGGQSDSVGINAESAMSPAGPSAITLSGTVREVRDVTLAGLDQPHRVGRLEAEDGRTARVDFGPANRVGELQLAEGDEVTLEGHRGMINDRPLLMATTLTKGGRSVQVERPDDRMTKRVRGRVESVRSVQFQGRDEETSVATVTMRSGVPRQVILGPSSKADEMALVQGDEVAMLVRPVRMNGRMTMIAQQVRRGDETFDLGTGDAAPSGTQQPPAEPSPAGDQPLNAPSEALPPPTDQPAPDNGR